MKNSCWPQLFETFPICTTSKCLTTGHVHRCQVSPDTDLLHCPSCKFMATDVASPNSLRLDLCALFYVSDDSEPRREETNNPVGKKNKKWDGEMVWERGDRRLPRLNLGPSISNTHSHSRRGCRTSHGDCQKGAALYVETGSSACYLSSSCSLAWAGCVCVAPCLLFARVSFSGLATWLIIISPSCFTYRHTSARLGLNRTEARLSGFGNCLLIHLNRIHESLRSLSV